MSIVTTDSTQISVRQQPPRLFSRFRQIPLAHGLRARYGQLHHSANWKLQSLLFSRSCWNTDTALAWSTQHGYAYPAQEGVSSSKLSSAFNLHTDITDHDAEFSVLDVIVLQEGPGKNQVYFEDDGQIYRENFTADVLEELVPMLEGFPLEAYTTETADGTPEFTHPPQDINQKTPRGLVGHQIGFLKDVWLDTTAQAGHFVVRAKAYFNETSLAQHVREVIRAAITQGAKFVPAPSINGMMLWEPRRQDHQNFFDAFKVLSMRSVEFVSRPAAGGAIYAVIEGERMNLLTLVKMYCQRFHIEGNMDADTPASFFESITTPDEILQKILTAYGSGEDEAAAMAILAEAALSADMPLDSEDEDKDKEQHDQEEEKTPERGKSIKKDDDVSGDDDEGQGEESSEKPTESQAVSGQVLEQLQSIRRLATQNSKFVKQQSEINKLLIDYVTDERAGKQQETLSGMVTEAVSKGLPVRRKAYWLDMIHSGQISDQKALKTFLEADVKVETAHERSVMESFRELPVSTRHLAGITVGSDEKDIPHLRAKLLFRSPVTESEKTLITERGVRPYMSLDDMYKDLVPGDDGYTGLPYGGQGVKYRRWVEHAATEGVTASDAVVKSTDFSNVLLQVVGELGLARWELLDKSFLDVVEIGPSFSNYVDSNVVVYGAAPDMQEWSEDSGYPELTAGARKPVTTSVKDWGGIMRWSKRVVIDNRMDMITEDVNAQIDATFRAVGRSVYDLILGYGSVSSGVASTINGAVMSDGNGVLYQTSAPRRNYVNGDGREYTNQVLALNLMMEQEDIAKAGQTPQMMGLVPGVVVCVNTAWSTIKGFWNASNKPGTKEPNELGLPNDQVPKISGVHQGFLRKRKDFVAFLPDPKLKGVIRMQYMNGQTEPKVTWQNASPMGRVFENGEIAAQFEYPLRVTLIREKGIFSIHQS